MSEASSRNAWIGVLGSIIVALIGLIPLYLNSTKGKTEDVSVKDTTVIQPDKSAVGDNDVAPPTETPYKMIFDDDICENSKTILKSGDSGFRSLRTAKVVQTTDQAIFYEPLIESNIFQVLIRQNKSSGSTIHFSVSFDDERIALNAFNSWITTFENCLNVKSEDVLQANPGGNTSHIKVEGHVIVLIQMGSLLNIYFHS